MVFRRHVHDAASLSRHHDRWANGILRIDRPELPPELERLTLRALEVGQSTVDVRFERIGDRVMAAPIGAVPPAVEILIRA